MKKYPQTVWSLVVFLVLTSDENGFRITSTIKGKKHCWFTLVRFSAKRIVACITLQSYLFVRFRVNTVHSLEIERGWHMTIYS